MGRKRQMIKDLWEDLFATGTEKVREIVRGGSDRLTEEIRKAALAYEAGLIDREIKRLAETEFKKMDVDGDERISIGEFADFLRKNDYPYDPTEIFSRIDGDRNGFLDFEEVMAFFYINQRDVWCHGCNSFITAGICSSNCGPEQRQQQDHETQEEYIKACRNKSDVAPVITKVQKEKSRLQRLEAGLARARAAIREAAQAWNETIDPDYVPQGPMYWKPCAFHSYMEMEKNFKVFVYEEGEPPLFHNGPSKSIYSMEGNFIHRLGMDREFRTRDAEKAHVFFLPFSVTMMVRFVYVPDSHDIGPIKRTFINYVDVLSTKYPYLNRSLGADHFILSAGQSFTATRVYEL